MEKSGFGVGQMSCTRMKRRRNVPGEVCGAIPGTISRSVLAPAYQEFAKLAQFRHFSIRFWPNQIFKICF